MAQVHGPAALRRVFKTTIPPIPLHISFMRFLVRGCK